MSSRNMNIYDNGEDPGNDPWVWIALLVLGAMTVVCLLSGCKTKSTVVTEVHTEYVTVHDTLRHKDSVFVDRSVFVQQLDSATLAENEALRDKLYNLGLKISSGDQLVWYVQDNTTKGNYQDQSSVTTTEIIKTDSIPVLYPVETPLTAWQKTRINAFWPLLIITLLSVAILVFFGCLLTRQKKS